MGLPIQWGVVVVPASMSASSMAEVDGVFGKCRSGPRVLITGGIVPHTTLDP